MNMVIERRRRKKKKVVLLYKMVGRVGILRIFFVCCMNRVETCIFER